MSTQRKVTLTIVTDSNDAAKIDQLATAKKIRMAALAADETMAGWARELGYSRQFIYQVVNGKRAHQKTRDFIEARLNAVFWPKPAECQQGATAR